MYITHTQIAAVRVIPALICQWFPKIKMLSNFRDNWMGVFLLLPKSSPNEKKEKIEKRIKKYKEINKNRKKSCEKEKTK